MPLYISGLSSTDSFWPLQLWDHLTTQAVTTLNILRKSKIDPTKSAYEQLHGHKYDWNAYMMAPPGTRAIIYEDALSRTSWGPRGMDAWYCGPSFDHYRCCIFYVPETRSMRISGSFDLFPQHCVLPTFTPEQHEIEVHNELTDAVHNLNKKSKKKLLTAMATALRKLATADNNPPQRVGEVPTSEGESPAQRVDEAPPITTTTNPTAPRTMQVAPRTHQRITRNNAPMATPAIVRPPAALRRSPHTSPQQIGPRTQFASSPN